MVSERAVGYQPIVFAMCLVSVLIITHSVVLRGLAARLAAPADKSAIDPNVLQTLPMQIGDWAGKELPLDDTVRMKIGAEGYVNRRYVRRSGLGPGAVSFYLSYGVKARSMMPHRPEICYISSGWALQEQHLLELPLGDGTILPCNAMEFSRGYISPERIVVLHHYIVDGQYCPDVSLLRSSAWRGSRMFSYVAQIQVVASATEPLGSAAALETVSDFAMETAPLVVDLLESSGTN